MINIFKYPDLTQNLLPTLTSIYSVLDPLYIVAQFVILDTRIKIYLHNQTQILFTGVHLAWPMGRSCRRSCDSDYLGFIFISVTIRQQHSPLHISIIIQTLAFDMLNQCHSAGCTHSRWEPFIPLVKFSKDKTLNPFLQIISHILSGFPSRPPITQSTNLGSAILMSELDIRHGYQLT